MCVKNDHGYLLFVITTIRSVPYLWLITEFAARITRWVPLMEQNKATLQVEVIATHILPSSSQSGWPLRNIHISNDYGSFTCYVVDVLFRLSRSWLLLDLIWLVSYAKQELLTFRENLHSPWSFGGVRVALHFNVLFCRIVCLYVLCYVVWCPLRLAHNTMFGSSLPCVWLCIVVSNIYCVVFCFSSSCVPMLLASLDCPFSGLSFLWIALSLIALSLIVLSLIVLSLDCPFSGLSFLWIVLSLDCPFSGFPFLWLSFLWLPFLWIALSLDCPFSGLSFLWLSFLWIALSLIVLSLIVLSLIVLSLIVLSLDCPFSGLSFLWLSFHWLPFLWLSFLWLSFLWIVLSLDCPFSGLSFLWLSFLWIVLSLIVLSLDCPFFDCPFSGLSFHWLPFRYSLTFIYY